MTTTFDAGAVLMTHGTYSSNQSFAPAQLYPRQLATSMLEIHLSSPPSSSCTFVVEVASTSGGVYSPIASLVWPAGLTGAKQVALGVNGSVAASVNNTSQWMRLSLVTTGALTGSAWLTKPTDGGPGFGMDPGDLVPAL